jgi:phage regulator Rha-like protein
MTKRKPKRRLLQNQKRGTVVPIESCIVILRRQKVILDTELAELYGVPVKRLNQQIKRNRERFPADFMFQLTAQETSRLRLQIATSNNGRGGRRSKPYAFTEHGAIMAATVLNSERAVHMSVFVVRAFVRLRDLLAGNRQVAAKIAELEDHLDTHDRAIRQIIDAIRRLTTRRAAPGARIGFQLPSTRAAS